MRLMRMGGLKTDLGVQRNMGNLMGLEVFTMFVSLIIWIEGLDIGGL